MPAFDVDSIVVGGGVVGLAVGRALALAGRETWVLERNERVVEETSSRNSGVIHAGLYYPPGSLKARLCTAGAHQLYAYCAQRGVAHSHGGKLVVAVDDGELPHLRDVLDNAHANGVRAEWLEAPDVARIEPHLRCRAAIDSPDSGIVDPAELGIALVGEIEQRGGRVVLHTAITSIECEDDAFVVVVAGGDRVRCRSVVNAAGHGAVTLAAATRGLPPETIPRIHCASGHYYTLRGRAPFGRLIYPLPEAHGLGVHLGFDLAGRCRFGPDVRWIGAPDFSFDDSQRTRFADSIRRWWPGLRDEDLQPDFVGVRPKLSGPGEPAADFRIDDASVHRVPNLINLFGIDSPGLTSCLAIGDEVAKRLDR